ncbi:transcriptional regulator [Chroococcidiopsis sp. CCNUC1]|uniref:transcriptional regulator n=1 Tax=Chroococcidiopsis sp. CCNUC1 TaxID=2653189 RepID=UPI002020B886|nr:transcriptional regulator [Chroococcidiopsis sp. CCNUC1]URD48496.1 transcriptional regulator [Chroococcidiopsis sp. CCNUC1]
MAENTDRYSGTKQKSPRRLHTAAGKFAPDYQEEPKRLRTMRLTDTAWAKLAQIADRNQITRSEVIEIFARDGELY